MGAISQMVQLPRLQFLSVISSRKLGRGSCHKRLQVPRLQLGVGDLPERGCNFIDESHVRGVRFNGADGGKLLWCTRENVG